MARDLAWSLETFLVGQDDEQAVHSAAALLASMSIDADAQGELPECLEMLGYTSERHAAYRAAEALRKNSE